MSMQIQTLRTRLRDSQLRTWYIKGQEWYAMKGEREFAAELPKNKREGFLMGFNAAKWVDDHNMQPAPVGTATWDTMPNDGSFQVGRMWMN